MWLAGQAVQQFGPPSCSLQSAVPPERAVQLLDVQHCVPTKLEFWVITTVAQSQAQLQA